MMHFQDRLLATLTGAAIASAIVIVQPLKATALTGQEVNDIAREITVLITSKDAQGNISNGSGVIISRNGNTYYVLTAKHVVQNPQKEYKLLTHDRQPQELSLSEENRLKMIELPNGMDLAVIEFSSDEDYPIATLSTAQLSEGVPVFVSGWPKQGSIGRQSEEQMIRQFSDGRVSSMLQQPIATGYQVGYTNVTRAGMSGGPVVDAGGRLVAIHGQADTAAAIENPGLESADNNSLQGLSLSTGFNYGIPIEAFLQQAPQAGLYLNLQVDNAAPPELGAPYVASAEPDERDVISDMNNVFGTVERGLGIIQGVCGLFGC
jgi:serine protease Do